MEFYEFFHNNIISITHVRTYLYESYNYQIRDYGRKDLFYFIVLLFYVRTSHVLLHAIYSIKFHRRTISSHWLKLVHLFWIKINHNFYSTNNCNYYLALQQQVVQHNKASLSFGMLRSQSFIQKYTIIISGSIKYYINKKFRDYD